MDGLWCIHATERFPPVPLSGAEASPCFLPHLWKEVRARERPVLSEGGERTNETPNDFIGGTYLFFHLGRAIPIYNIYIYLNTPIYIHMHVRTREAACVRMPPRGER